MVTKVKTKVWLFRVTGEGFNDAWWGTTDADSKADAKARIRRRMCEYLGNEYDQEFELSSLTVEVWEHKFFTVATGYM